MFPIRDHNPAERTPYVTWALIAINIAIWLGTLGISTNEAALSSFYDDYALLPAQLMNGENPMALVTSAFLHGSFMHLAGNMLFLWIYGDNMEDQMGHGGFLLFYLACGVGAGLAQVAASPGSQVPMVGASGAIAGVMGGYLLMFPKARVDILLILIIIFRTFSLPAWILLGLWFALQLFGGIGADPEMGGVAYWAHAGGFVLGIVLTVPLWLRRGGTEFWTRTHGHPPHPAAPQITRRTRVPVVRK
ncbi:MAG: rhomboid family intramembrane serine protease [Rhodobacterales bacterium]|nr:MAG: rhomboid family intramembrane serine protease [Rhodobacterales bacterium]